MSNNSILQQAQEAAHITTSNIPPAASFTGAATAFAAGVLSWNVMIGLLGVAIGLIGAAIQYKNYRLNREKDARQAKLDAEMTRNIRAKELREAAAHEKLIRVQNAKLAHLEKAPAFDLPDSHPICHPSFSDTDIRG